MKIPRSMVKKAMNSLDILPVAKEEAPLLPAEEVLKAPDMKAKIKDVEREGEIVNEKN